MKAGSRAQTHLLRRLTRTCTRRRRGCPPQRPVRGAAVAVQEPQCGPSGATDVLSLSMVPLLDSRAATERRAIRVVQSLAGFTENARYRPLTAKRYSRTFQV
jgi:hypothetical protein